jgi:hypothetical protein
MVRAPFKIERRAIRVKRVDDYMTVTFAILAWRGREYREEDPISARMPRDLVRAAHRRELAAANRGVRSALNFYLGW